MGRSVDSPAPVVRTFLRKILSPLRPLLIFTAIVALVPCAFAQRSAGGGARSGVSVHAGVPHRSPGANSVSSVERARDRFSRRAGPYSYLSLPFPFWDDAVDAGDLYSSGYPVSAPLPPFMPAGAFSGYGGNSIRGIENAQSAEPSQPLMIELQNGHYVQVSSTAIDGEPAPLGSRPDDARMVRPDDQGPIIAAPAANELAPVALIFRDGHSEQVHDYTIADGTLYARGDYYTDGYWNRKIDLASLNLAETMQANASRNIHFVLPSSPNEVITRP